MKVGITLPQFRRSPDDLLEGARVADEVGLDGIFVFDHLWAVGQPDRPALNCWPLLGALAATTERIILGSLVARVSLLPDAVLAHNVETMLTIVGPDRFIAGLGAGDHLSEAENIAYGVAFPSVDERLDRLADCAQRCTALGAHVWVGGLSPRVREVAVANSAAHNLWGVKPSRIAKEVSLGAVDVTWGGVAASQVDDPHDVHAIAAHMAALDAAGATWAVYSPAYVDGVDPRGAITPVADAMASVRA